MSNIHITYISKSIKAPRNHSLISSRNRLFLNPAKKEFLKLETPKGDRPSRYAFANSLKQFT